MIWSFSIYFGLGPRNKNMAYKIQNSLISLNLSRDSISHIGCPNKKVMCLVNSRTNAILSICQLSFVLET